MVTKANAENSRFSIREIWFDDIRRRLASCSQRIDRLLSGTKIAKRAQIRLIYNFGDNQETTALCASKGGRRFDAEKIISE